MINIKKPRIENKNYFKSRILNNKIKYKFELVIKLITNKYYNNSFFYSLFFLSYYFRPLFLGSSHFVYSLIPKTYYQKILLSYLFSIKLFRFFFL